MCKKAKSILPWYWSSRSRLIALIPLHDVKGREHLDSSFSRTEKGCVFLFYDRSSCAIEKNGEIRMNRPRAETSAMGNMVTEISCWMRYQPTIRSNLHSSKKSSVTTLINKQADATSQQGRFDAHQTIGSGSFKYLLLAFYQRGPFCFLFSALLMF